jgi:hypothetical protein
MDTLTAPRFVVRVHNAVNDQWTIGPIASSTDADVCMAELRIRYSGLSVESIPLVGLRQAAAVCTDLLGRENGPPQTNRPRVRARKRSGREASTSLPEMLGD